MALALEAGVCGYLLKRTSLMAELPQAIMHVLAGDRYLGLGVREKRLAVEGEEGQNYPFEHRGAAGLPKRVFMR